MQVEPEDITPPDSLMTAEILESLTCPVCREYMVPPILSCENQHSFCEACRGRLELCPICKSEFVAARNHELEKLTRMIQYPCTNEQYGCAEQCPAKGIKLHEESCQHRRFVCVLRDNPDTECNFFGTLEALKTHLMEKHTEDVFTIQGPPVQIRLQLFPRIVRKVVFAYDELFIQQADVSTDGIHISVLHVGPKSQASKYRFEVCLINKRTLKRFSLCEKVQNHDIPLYRVIASGRSAVIPSDTIDNFLDDEVTFSVQFKIFVPSACSSS